MCYPVAFCDVFGCFAVVDEDYLDFASVVLVDEAGGVEDCDAFFECEAGSGEDFCGGAVWELEADAGAYGVAFAWAEFDVFCAG